MYVRSFRKAAHVRRFIIRPTEDSGWEVVDERDRRIVRTVSYDDWHRVERAKAAFAVEASALADGGWVEIPSSDYAAM
jgi:hypothetical protein